MEKSKEVLRKEYIHQKALHIYWQKRYNKEKHNYLILLLQREEIRLCSLQKVCRKLFSESEIDEMIKEARVEANKQLRRID